MAVSGTSLAILGAGGIFLYGAIAGKSPLAAGLALVRGQNPSNVAQTTGLPIGLSGANTSVNGGVPNPSGSGNFQAVVNYLQHDLGCSLAGTAGGAGNIQIESGFSTTIENSSEGAIGLVQWEGGRRTALQKYAAQHGMSETDLSAQLGFMGQELRGPYILVLAAMKTATNPENAAAIWDSQYEKSAGTTRSARQAAARQIYTQLGGK